MGVIYRPHTTYAKGLFRGRGEGCTPLSDLNKDVRSDWFGFRFCLEQGIQFITFCPGVSLQDVMA